MTAALLRICNGCKKPFVKEGGCNRMYCSSCPNSQCFLCSISVTDYTHFSDAGPCRLYDKAEAEQLNAAIMQAQGNAISETLRSRDDVNIEVLTVDKSLLPPDFNRENDLPAPVKRHRGRLSRPPPPAPPPHPILNERNPVEAELAPQCRQS
jgi:hypothetical protein